MVLSLKQIGKQSGTCRLESGKMRVIHSDFKDKYLTNTL